MGELTTLFIATMLGFFVLVHYSEVGYEYILLSMRLNISITFQL